MPFRALIAASLVLACLVGCSDSSRPRRTWRPSDHAQPEGATGPAPQGGATPSSPAETEAVSAEQARAAAAASLYRIRCAGCHGVEGHGDGPERAPVMQIPDFASAEFQSQRSDEALASAIARGRNMMPPFGDQIAPDGIAALVAHVRRLGAR